MKINILTLFPEMFAPLQESMLGRAREKGILDINLINIRDYTEDKHNRVDDTPFGGGAGMVMQVQPILSAYRENHLQGPCLYMSPRGKMLNGEMAESLSRQEEITILCGHYEGVDQRALDLLQAEEVTIGDYILTGGEYGGSFSGRGTGRRGIGKRRIRLFRTSGIPSLHQTAGGGRSRCTGGSGQRKP